VGNLPFDVQDEAIYMHFARCGKIEFIRIVRDKKTNIGKGFGYVQFRVSSLKVVLMVGSGGCG
jgi:nucleolar protein 12